MVLFAQPSWFLHFSYNNLLKVWIENSLLTYIYTKEYDKLLPSKRIRFVISKLDMCENKMSGQALNLPLWIN